jgi:hypothetical protein
MLVQSSAVSDQPPYVLIAANPYEDKLVRRALELTGLRVEATDGVDALRARVERERPLVIVVAEGWMAADVDEVLAALEAAPTVPVYVVADVASDRASAGRVRVFVRPIDAEEIADAIEKLAVAAEQARDAGAGADEDAEIIPSESIAEVIEEGALEIEADSEEDWRQRPPTKPRLARIALNRVAVPRANGTATASPPPPPQPRPVSDLPRVETPARTTSPSMPALARLDELDDFALDDKVPPPRIAPTQILPPEPAARTAATAASGGVPVGDEPRAPRPPDGAALDDAPPPIRAQPTVRIGPARVELLRADDAMDVVGGLGGESRPSAPPATRITDVELPVHLEVSPASAPTVTAPRDLAVRAAAAAAVAAAVSDGSSSSISSAAAPPPPQRFVDRSTFARRLDDQLSEVERRLFPDAPTSSVRRYDDYDDALDDIDLDNLGVDTLPGLSAERLAERLDGAPRRPAPSSPAARRPGLEDAPTPAFDGQPTPRIAAFDSAPTPRIGPLRDIPTALEDNRGRPLRTSSDDSPLDRLRATTPRAASSSEAARLAIDQPIARPLPEEGSLADSDVCALLLQLHAAGYCGRLVVARGDGEKQIDFDGGTPIAARSSFAHDRLGDLLFREGKLTREQHARTRELTVEPGRKTAQAFVELGLLKANEIFPALRRQAEEILYSIFAWTQGTFRLVAAEVPAEERLRLSAHPWALYLEGVRRKYGLDRLGELVGADAVLHPTTALEQVLVDAALTAAERRVADGIDGTRSIAELVRLGATRKTAVGDPPRPGEIVDETGVFGLAWFLLSVGAAQLEAMHEARGAARVDVRAVSTVVEPLDAGESAVERRRARRERNETPADRAVDRERVRAKRAQLDDADYFAILGVERDATPHEIARAHDRLAAEFAPGRFPPELRDELAADLALIAATLDEARRVLADDAVRTAYRSHLAAAI